MTSEPLPEDEPRVEPTPAAGEPLGWWRRMRAGLGRLGRRMLPGPPTLRGAGRGAAVIAILLAALLGSTLRIGLGPVLDPILGALMGLVLAGLVGLGTVLALKLLGLLPRLVGWLGAFALGVLVFDFMAGLDFPPPVALVVGLALGFAHAALGGALGSLRGGGASNRPAKRAVLVCLVVLVVLVVALDVFLIGWTVWRGSTEHLVKLRHPDPVRVAPLDAPDPSRPGPYRVLTLTYGSGTDRHRPEFGAKAGLRTPTVDATPFVTGNEGWGIGVRDWFWGFGAKKFPLNGRVWYPDGSGPFPLVLIVHGNHSMTHFSDPGYAYLGELLASRGFITVSVDENFFNGYWSAPLKKENDGRGWLLLKHLEVWRRWNRTPGHRFQGKVDLADIALIGHSRGGEAAGIAASFNRLARYPDDAKVRFGFGFGIRSVVAIAPSDSQYKPAGKPTPVSGVSYLLLQGGHDGDVSIFLGERLYRRLDLGGLGQDPYRFKAILYAYRANHGQFNTVWGDADAGWPNSLLLNRAPLLDPAAQRRIAELAISGFLEATLHQDPRYVRLFRDPRSVRAWLPDDLYVSRFLDSTFHKLADYEEDVDVTRASAPGTAIDGRGLALWKEKDLPFRKGENTREDQAVYLGWKRSAGKAPATYSLTLPASLADGWHLGPGSLLTFALADTGDEPPADETKGGKKDPAAEKARKEREAKEKEARAERDRKEGKEPLDLTVELVAQGGAAARLPLSRFRAMPIPLRSRFTKLPKEEGFYGDAVEPVLQTFELPLAAFAQAAPGFDPAALRTVRLVFDRSPEGVVILDDVGFAEATRSGTSAPAPSRPPAPSSSR